MLRKVIIISLVLVVPLAFYIAAQYGQLPEVSFSEAITKTVTEVEGDQVPRVIVVSTIQQVGGADLVCTDAVGQSFNVNFTGSEPKVPFIPGQTVRFVGHVHGADPYYFHATQVYSR